ncbi:hypothetical protein DSL72_007000 [Monilinia vaccinii-corymbosi]|uniref:Uncharacterized protein n=1 Tax=Monilinia vaccinii-corymbosi TaxID=61207 RepID=A0A8A3PKL6_9HELO|nr:hypothetical protein DSL72_007000 [Monilinia vaccinii-corymbosi]
MLPEGLSSSYKRYRDNTNIFSAWLGQTAEEVRIMKTLPAHHANADSTMLSIVDITYFPTMKHLKAPREGNDTTDLDDFLYYPVYQIINKTTRALQDCEPKKFSPAVPPLSLSLFSKEVEGQWVIDGKQEDDVKLTQFLLELAIQEKFQGYGGFKTPPNEPGNNFGDSMRSFYRNCSGKRKYTL